MNYANLRSCLNAEFRPLWREVDPCFFFANLDILDVRLKKTLPWLYTVYRYDAGCAAFIKNFTPGRKKDLWCVSHLSAKRKAAEWVLPLYIQIKNKYKRGLQSSYLEFDRETNYYIFRAQGLKSQRIFQMRDGWYTDLSMLNCFASPEKVQCFLNNKLEENLRVCEKEIKKIRNELRTD